MSSWGGANRKLRPSASPFVIPWHTYGVKAVILGRIYLSAHPSQTCILSFTCTTLLL